MNNIFTNIKSIFKNGDVTTRLIFVNVALFIVIGLLSIFLKLLGSNAISISFLFSVPSDAQLLILHFWTPITYMFYHEAFLHVFFNMLMLFWFGRFFLLYFSQKQLLSLYFFGGIMGALFFVLGYNFLPFYTSDKGILMGASASIMAILTATAFRAPNMEIQLILIGRVKLMWIAIIMVLISVFGLTSTNGGGELSHLGGAFGGYLFVFFQNKNKNILAPIDAIISFFVMLFRPKPKKKTFKNVYHSQKLSPEEYNQKKAQDEKDVDIILDKIKKSGYESLTSEEKQKLFERK